MAPALGPGGDRRAVVLSLGQAVQPSGRTTRQREASRAAHFQAGVRGVAQLGQLLVQGGQPLPWAAGYTTCDRDGQRTPGATVAIAVKPDEQSRAAAAAVAAAGVLQLGGCAVPAAWGRTAAPAGTVKVLVQGLPEDLWERGQGVMAALLVAAGYGPDLAVSEHWGCSSAFGDAPAALPCADTLVAYVRTPPGEPMLSRLPDDFVSDGRRVRVYVAGRAAGEWRGWRASEQTYERALARLEADAEGAEAAPQRAQARAPAPPVAPPPAQGVPGAGAARAGGARAGGAARAAAGEAARGRPAAMEQGQQRQQQRQPQDLPGGGAGDAATRIGPAAMELRKPPRRGG
ncbi:hypothetical protein HT031_003674 [Scenedesmus sp. PABB004]|nr:hypothetical protein HT031_003674 [Scenedesmus sp. PABB004]